MVSIFRRAATSALVGPCGAGAGGGGGGGAGASSSSLSLTLTRGLPRRLMTFEGPGAGG